MREIIKKLKELKPEQKRKLAAELGVIAIAILGVVIFVLNLLKIVPTDNIVIGYIIAYGFLIGPAITALAIAAFFFEVRTIPVRKFRKGAR